jgi:hypothetical protein
MWTDHLPTKPPGENVARPLFCLWDLNRVSLAQVTFLRTKTQAASVSCCQSKMQTRSFLQGLANIPEHFGP